MKPALATLPSSRGPILIVERGRLHPIHFDSVEEAERFLNGWRDEAEGMAALRSAARELPGVGDGALGRDDAVVRAVARAVVAGSIVLIEPTVQVPPMPIRRTTTSSSSSSSQGSARAAIAAQQAAAPAAPAAPAAVPAAPAANLPALKEVSIEGAEVLPEVLQAMDQIDLALAEVEEVGTSLAPAPDGVPAIADEMSGAVGAVQDRLGSV